MKTPRVVLIAVLLLPAMLYAQTDAVGKWKAVFVGPMGSAPQMVDALTFSISATADGFTGTARAEPEWPGKLDVSG